MVIDSKLVTNLAQILITITEDKIRICLMRHLKSIEEKDKWLAPAGIIITIILTLITTDFKDFIFSKETWQSFFVIVLILAFGWLVFSLYHRLRAKNIDDLIKELKNDEH